jgi:flagellin-like protein
LLWLFDKVTETKLVTFEWTPVEELNLPISWSNIDKVYKYHKLTYTNIDNIYREGDVMKDLLKSKKAISPIIATLLLVAIAVAAAVIAYSWVMGFLGSATATSAPAQGQIAIENVAGLTDGATTITVTIRNTGNKAVTVDVIYVTDTSTGNAMTLNKDNGGLSATDYAISPGTAKDFTCTLSDPAVKSHGYTFKVVCTDGTIATATYTAS